MQNIYKVGLFVLVCSALLSVGTAALAYSIPTANAGPDLYATSGQSVLLQGSGYDSNGYALNYAWTCSGGTVSNYSLAQPVYTAPFINTYNNQATYICTLTVSNNYGQSNSDSAVVYVNSNNNGSNYVQTNSATNMFGSQVTLNGSFTGNNVYSSNSVYFQWGTTIGYGYETPTQYLNNANAFSQTIAGLTAGTIYHFRAVAQGNYGTVYGQDMTFYGSSSGSGYYGNGTLTASKAVINLTSGNLNWQTSISAKPSDVLSFAITLQTNGQDIHNVVIRDILPSNLIYKGNLTVNTGSNYTGNIMSGINIGTVYAGQPVVIAYQAQLAAAGSFAYGITTIANNATVTSNEAGTQNTSATVTVNKSLVYGASTVSTGLTNGFLTDSFFLPMFLIVLCAWLYFTGRVYKFADWIKSKI
jgi:hypothetical protein